MKKVFVNGYGSIGSRIAKFIKDDSDIVVIGIGKHSPDEKVQYAIDDGFSVYVPEDKSDNFKDYNISGSIESILDDCDLVIDASPGGNGFINKKNIRYCIIIKNCFTALKNSLNILWFVDIFFINESVTTG